VIKLEIAKPILRKSILLVVGVGVIAIGLLSIAMGPSVRQISYSVQIPFEVEVPYETVENKTQTLFTEEKYAIDPGDHAFWSAYIPSGRNVSFSFQTSVDINATVITDNEQTAFWILANFGGGSIGANISNDSQVKQEGADSLRINTGSGSCAYWEIYHIYASRVIPGPPQDWSSKEVLSFYWYGSNTNSTVRIYSWSGDDVFYYEFMDNWTGWRRLEIPFENFTFTSGASLKKVDTIAIQQRTPNVQGTWYVDHVTVQVEMAVRAYVFTADQYDLWAAQESAEPVLTLKERNATLHFLTSTSSNYTFVIHNYHLFENASVQFASAIMAWQDTVTENRNETRYSTETRYRTEEDYIHVTVGGAILVLGVTLIVIGVVVQKTKLVARWRIAPTISLPMPLVRLVKYLVDNPGCIFILVFQALLLSAAAALISGLEAFANEIIIYAFFSLFVGIIIQMIIVVREKHVP